MPTNDHPEAHKLGWRLDRTRTCFENQLIRVREDQLVVGGETRQFAYVEKAPAVLIVPVTVDRQIALVRQYRYPVDAHCLEVPAGTSADAGDLSLEELAAKELHEEIGAAAAVLERISSFLPDSALTTEQCHVFLATGVVLADPAEPEPMEKIEIHLVSINEALHLARTGGVQTGPAALALLMCELRLRELSAGGR